MSEHDFDPSGASPTPDPAGDAAMGPGEQVRQLQEALEARTREAQANQERYLRAAAEFDNARKRAIREREELVLRANDALIRELLPILDNFERALQAARSDPAAAAVVTGIELIQRELLRVLEKFGVTALTSVGEPFDPERHEAVARVPAEQHPDMTVVAETARGYLLHGRVLRPAMVTVAMKPEDGSASDTEPSEP